MRISCPEQKQTNKTGQANRHWRQILHVDRRIGQWLQTHEKRLVLVLCLSGALRVLIYAAAFPYFGNVDEFQHFDMVMHYAQTMSPPPGQTPYNEQALTARALLETGAYRGEQDRHPNLRKRLAHPGFLPQQEAKTIKRWQGHHNYESQQPPLYYLIAGMWHRLGQWLGLGRAIGVFWIKILNGFFFFGLPLLAYQTTRHFFDPDPVWSLGAALLVSLIPQDCFYTITNDSLHPVLFALSFYLLLRLARGDATKRAWLLTGLTIAAAFLTKFSTIALFPLFGLVVAKLLWQARSTGKARVVFMHATLCLAAVAPLILCWCARNMAETHTPTGNQEHLQRLKALSDIPDHEFFSPRGVTIFVAGVTTRFWQGELYWNGKQLWRPAHDRFYFVSSVLLTGIAFFAALFGDKKRRFAMMCCFVAVGVSIMFLAGLSVAFDYEGLLNRPFIVAGRLIFGAVVPFSILYMRGLQIMLAPVKLKTLPFLILTAIMIWISIGEAIFTAPVFASGFNAYHLMMQ